MNAEFSFEHHPTLPVARKTNLFVLLVIVFVITLSLTFGYAFLLDKRDKEYTYLASEQRILTLQLTNNASRAIKANAEAFTQLENARDQFERVLSNLTQGNPETRLPPSPTQLHAELRAITNQWQAFREHIDTLLKTEGVIRILHEYAQAIKEVLPEQMELLNEIITTMISAGINPQSIYQINRLLILSQRIDTYINTITQGNADSKTAIEFFEKVTTEFKQTLTYLTKGNRQLGLKRVTNKEVVTKLKELESIFMTIEALVSRILDKSPQLFLAQKAANHLLAQSHMLENSASLLGRSYTNLAFERIFISYAGYGLSLLIIILLFWLNASLIKKTRHKLNEEIAQNYQTQDAIQQLLNDISTLANGDLSVRATVGKEITGALADAVNYAISALITLVRAIKHVTNEVASSAEETQATAIHLARASDRQAQQINQVTHSVTTMAKAIELVSNHAKKSTAVAENSVNIAAEGVLAVQNTITGMQSIKEDIRITANLIKRLGESSQEIGDVMEIITDIAEQTNILALNAAIKATGTDDVGVRFATVADEVQQLAERVGQTTHKIESLVDSIRVDTNRAVTSMEQTTAIVSKGSMIAETAGESLHKIEIVSSDLSSLIQNISGAADQLAGTAIKISKSMETIRTVTHQNLAGTKHTATLTGKLVILANELEKTVSGFKLPPPTDEKTD